MPHICLLTTNKCREFVARSLRLNLRKWCHTDRWAGQTQIKRERPQIASFNSKQAANNKENNIHIKPSTIVVIVVVFLPVYFPMKHCATATIWHQVFLQSSIFCFLYQIGFNGLQHSLCSPSISPHQYHYQSKVWLTVYVPKEYILYSICWVFSWGGLSTSQ